MYLFIHSHAVRVKNFKLLQNQSKRTLENQNR